MASLKHLITLVILLPRILLERSISMFLCNIPAQSREVRYDGLRDNSWIKSRDIYVLTYLGKTLNIYLSPEKMADSWSSFSSRPQTYHLFLQKLIAVESIVVATLQVTETRYQLSPAEKFFIISIVIFF